MPPPVVHIVEDDAAVRDALAILLRLHGYRVREHATGENFLASDERSAAGCVLTDVQMPGLSGLEMLARMRADGLRLPAIVMSGRAERRMAQDAAAQGAQFVDKPFSPAEIVAAVRAAIGSSD